MGRGPSFSVAQVTVNCRQNQICPTIEEAPRTRCEAKRPVAETALVETMLQKVLMETLNQTMVLPLVAIPPTGMDGPPRYSGNV